MKVAVATTVQMLLIAAASHACPPFGYPSRSLVMRVVTRAPGHRPGRRHRTTGHPGPPRGATAPPAETATRGVPSPPACRPGPTPPADSRGDWTRTGDGSSVYRPAGRAGR